MPLVKKGRGVCHWLKEKEVCCWLREGRRTGGVLLVKKGGSVGKCAFR